MYVDVQNESWQLFMQTFLGKEASPEIKDWQRVASFVERKCPDHIKLRLSRKECGKISCRKETERIAKLIKNPAKAFRRGKAFEKDCLCKWHVATPFYLRCKALLEQKI